METRIIETTVQYRVLFSPTRPNDLYDDDLCDSPPVHAESRWVSDISEILSHVRSLVFYDVVMTTVSIGGVEETIESFPCNRSGPFPVAHDEEDATRLIAEGWQAVPVHPNLVGRVWVFGRSDLSNQPKEQQLSLISAVR